jgi:aminopeptidase N
MLPNEMKLALRPGDSKSFSPQTYNAQILSNFAGHELDMPLMVPSVLLRGTSYGYASYYKPAVAYALLKDMLGNDVFTKTLQEYMNRWHGKHPIPYDFFYTFNDVLQQELNWFWKPWFFEMGYPDLAIKDVRLEDKKVKISIERIGNLPLPVHLTVTFTDNTKEIIKEPMKSWSTGAKEIILEREFVKAVKKVELGSNLVPDVKPENNIWSFRKN